LVVISEGLINYFDKDLLKQLIQSIAHYGTSFKKLHYLTDLYPEPVKNKLASIIWNSSKLLKLMSRSSFSFHFKSPEEVKNFFEDAGFNQVSVQQPQIFFGQVPSNDHEQHLGDLVWIIHSQTK